MSVPSIESYHVGWLCALQVEYTVARALLDEVFEQPDLPSNATRDPLECLIYTCGRISKHNIVIRCLPKGTYGISSAVSAAKDMMHDFPALRIRLMVGIGGGAPSWKHDIRLGDVIVSSPTGQTGGVIQYDAGKIRQNREFEQTGSLDKPPPLLLSALQELDTLHKHHGHRINATIDNLSTKNSRLGKIYRRPPQETDVLYSSSFVHNDESRSCTHICQGVGSIVPRSERATDDDNPAVHYGLIASADALMRDATIRDALSREKEILCFEMEAAGLIEHFRCIVIRGVSDYADTHKNDLWQGYAAATAASYAKELLAVIPRPQSRTLTQSSLELVSLPVTPNTTQNCTEPAWIQGQSRQSTCTDLHEATLQVDLPLSEPSNYRSSPQIHEKPEGTWVRCSCKLNCGLEWNFSDKRATFRPGPNVSDWSHCELKDFADSFSKTSKAKFRQGFLAGPRGRKLWDKTRVKWEAANSSQGC